MENKKVNVEVLQEKLAHVYGDDANLITGYTNVTQSIRGNKRNMVPLNEDTIKMDLVENKMLEMAKDVFGSTSKEETLTIGDKIIFDQVAEREPVRVATKKERIEKYRYAGVKLFREGGIVMSSADIAEDENGQYMILNITNDADGTILQVEMPLVVGKFGNTQYYKIGENEYASLMYGFMMEDGTLRFFDLVGRFLKTLKYELDNTNLTTISFTKLNDIANRCKKEILFGEKNSMFGGATINLTNSAEDKIPLSESARFYLKDSVIIDTRFISTHINEVFSSRSRVKDTPEVIAESMKKVLSVAGLDFLGMSQNNDLLYKPCLCINYNINNSGFLVRKADKDCISEIGDIYSNFSIINGIGGDGTRKSPSIFKMRALLSGKVTHLRTTFGNMPIDADMVSVGFAWTDTIQGIDSNTSEQFFITEAAYERLCFKESQKAGKTSAKADLLHKIKGQLRFHNDMNVDLIMPIKENGGVAKMILAHYQFTWLDKNPENKLTPEMLTWGYEDWKKFMPEVVIDKVITINGVSAKGVVLRVPMYLQYGQDANEHAKTSEFRIMASFGSALMSAIGGDTLTEVMADMNISKWIGAVLGSGYDPLTKKFMPYFSKEEAEKRGMHLGIKLNVAFHGADRNVLTNRDIRLLHLFDNDINFKQTVNALIAQQGVSSYYGDEFKALLKEAASQTDMDPSTAGLVILGYALFNVFSGKEVPNAVANKYNSIRWVEFMPGKYMPCSPAVMAHNRVSPEISMTVKMAVKFYGLDGTDLERIILDRLTVDKNMNSIIWARKVTQMKEDAENLGYHIGDVLAADAGISLFFKKCKAHEKLLTKLSNFQEGGKGHYMKALTHDDEVDVVYVDRETYNDILKYYKSNKLDPKDMYIFGIKFPIIEIPGLKFRVSTKKFAPEGCIMMNYWAYINMSGADCDGDGIVFTYVPRRWHDLYNAKAWAKPVELHKNRTVSIDELVNSVKVKPYLENMGDIEMLRASNTIAMFLLIALKEFTASTTFAGARYLNEAVKHNIVEIGNMEQVCGLAKELGDYIQQALDLKHLGYSMFKPGVTPFNMAKAVRDEKAIQMMSATTEFGYFNEKRKAEGTFGNIDLEAISSKESKKTLTGNDIDAFFNEFIKGGN